jgi:hypothetical protein
MLNCEKLFFELMIVLSGLCSVGVGVSSLLTKGQSILGVVLISLGVIAVLSGLYSFIIDLIKSAVENTTSSPLKDPISGNELSPLVGSEAQET